MIRFIFEFVPAIFVIKASVVQSEIISVTFKRTNQISTAPMLAAKHRGTYLGYLLNSVKSRTKLVVPPEKKSLL